MKERIWDGKTITESGLIAGIPLTEYHGKRDLFDGPSISKSILKWLLPYHGGSPKAFWGRWNWNEKAIEPDTSVALDFGKAAHALILGDQVFADEFAVRPGKAPDGRAWNANNLSCKGWLAEQADAGRTVITGEQLDRIRRIADDMATNPLVRDGILNGRVERTMAWKDPATGIWLKTRPDCIPEFDGVFADLKTTGKLSEDFLERQVMDAGYYLQGAMTRMVCREIDMPFQSFVLVYVLNDDVPDTACVELSEHELDRGERAIRWCLDTIHRCLDAGEWPGARPFGDGAHALQMKKWAKGQIDDFLEREEALHSHDERAAA